MWYCGFVVSSRLRSLHFALPKYAELTEPYLGKPLLHLFATGCGGEDFCFPWLLCLVTEYSCGGSGTLLSQEFQDRRNFAVLDLKLNELGDGHAQEACQALAGPWAIQTLFVGNAKRHRHQQAMRHGFRPESHGALHALPGNE